jgi:hypothetical protein
MAASDVVVGTGQGPVRGSCAAGIWSFKGRRPVMRFGEPSAVVDDPHAARRAVWDGVR